MSCRLFPRADLCCGPGSLSHIENLRADVEHRSLCGDCCVPCQERACLGVCLLRSSLNLNPLTLPSFNIILGPLRWLIGRDPQSPHLPVCSLRTNVTKVAHHKSHARFRSPLARMRILTGRYNETDPGRGHCLAFPRLRITAAIMSVSVLLFYFSQPETYP